MRAWAVQNGLSEHDAWEASFEELVLHLKSARTNARTLLLLHAMETALTENDADPIKKFRKSEISGVYVVH